MTWNDLFVLNRIVLHKKIELEMKIGEAINIRLLFPNIQMAILIIGNVENFIESEKFSRSKQYKTNSQANWNKYHKINTKHFQSIKKCLLNQHCNKITILNWEIYYHKKVTNRLSGKARIPGNSC